MHCGIVAHGSYVDASNVKDLREMDFVFLSLDKGGVKGDIIDELEASGTPFIDVGMGLDLTDGLLGGVLRVTASTEEKRDHVRSNHRVSLEDGAVNDAYSQNIQIADLNALNATLAVIKWKKLFGVYRDLENEHHSTYTLDGNLILNEDQA